MPAWRFGTTPATNSALTTTSFVATAVWQRFTSDGAALNLGYNSIFGIADDLANSSAFTVYVFGMQLVRADWAGNYVRTTGARIDTPAQRGLRSPVSGRVALPVTQNLITYSEDFSNAAWVPNTGTTVTAATTDVPDPKGGQSASKLVYNGSGVAGDYRVYQVGPFSTVGSPETVSMFLRVLSGTKALRLMDNASLVLSPPFTVTTTWQRFAWTGVSQGPYNVVLGLFDDVGANAAFTVYLWGAQVVFANWAGPYVKTTGSTISPGTALRNIP